MLQCQLGGEIAQWGHLKAMYACQSPRCPNRNVTICWDCLVKKLGAATDALGQPTTCPTCGFGQLKYLGNH